MRNCADTAQSNTGCDHAACAEPAGKDSRAFQRGYFPEIKYSFSLRCFFVLPIVFYKRVISPFLPDCCRFIPTCSAYAAEAFMTHGVFKGFALSLWRVLRCNPFGGSGYDPVPPKHKDKACVK